MEFLFATQTVRSSTDITLEMINLEHINLFAAGSKTKSNLILMSPHIFIQCHIYDFIPHVAVQNHIQIRKCNLQATMWAFNREHIHITKSHGYGIMNALDAKFVATELQAISSCGFLAADSTNICVYDLLLGNTQGLDQMHQVVEGLLHFISAAFENQTFTCSIQL